LFHLEISKALSLTMTAFLN